MIFDLNLLKPKTTIEKNTDVCIVGGGTAGIYIAQALAKNNINSSIIELGNKNIKSAKESFLSPIFASQLYRGANLGRFSGLGGTSTMWGGQMIKLSENDFQISAKEYSSWPFTRDYLDIYYDKVLRTLGLYKTTHKSSPVSNIKEFFQDTFLNTKFSYRASTWLPFRSRNFSNKFSKIIKQSSKIDIWINAKLKNFSECTFEKGQVKKLTFYGGNNQSLVMSAKIFVFTMGAIESTRHVLEFTRLHSLGNNFSTPFCDHISTKVGYLNIKKKYAFYKYFAPFFVDGIMRSPRFETNASFQKDLNIPSAFVHFTSQIKDGSALYIFKQLALKFQRNNADISLKNINFFKLIYDLFYVSFWRIFKKRLVLSYDNPVLILIDIEQKPSPDNTIKISSSDDLVIDWKISKKDRDLAVSISKHFYECWSKSKKLKEIAELVLLPPKEISNGNFYDVYHPTGSLPFGLDANKTILNENLLVRGTNNLYVSSTAIFPSAGSANPGLTHLALTERLAEHISSSIND